MIQQFYPDEWLDSAYVIDYEQLYNCLLYTSQVPHGCVMVDGLGVGDVGNIVLRDRQMLSQNGLLIVVLTLEKYSNQLLAGPDIVSRGFVYVRESESLMEDARRVVSDALDDCLNHNISCLLYTSTCRYFES